MLLGGAPAVPMDPLSIASAAGAIGVNGYRLAMAIHEYVGGAKDVDKVVSSFERI